MTAAKFRTIKLVNKVYKHYNKREKSFLCRNKEKGIRYNILQKHNTERTGVGKEELLTRIEMSSPCHRGPIEGQCLLLQ